MNITPFKGKVALITGASAGLGKAMAQNLAAQGARVAIAARRPDRLEETAIACRDLGADVLTVVTDIADEAQCRTLIDKTIETFGQLDLLINNAGAAATALFEDFPNLSLFHHIMDVNFYGAVNCTYFALPYLKQTQGRIVMISSMGGKATIPYNTTYCSSKFALHGFSDSLRPELRKYGVSLTVICPWWVITEFHEAQMDVNGKAKGPSGRAFYDKKMMTAEKCAEITLNAATHRRREVLMGPGLLAVLLKDLAPGLLDYLAIKTILEPISKKTKMPKC